MTRGIILTRVTVIVTWHDDNLTRDNFFYLKKKNQKIEELTRGTPSNGVNLDLTKRVNMRRFNKKGNQFKTFKNLGTIIRF